MRTLSSNATSVSSRPRGSEEVEGEMHGSANSGAGVNRGLGVGAIDPLSEVSFTASLGCNKVKEGAETHECVLTNVVFLV